MRWSDIFDLTVAQLREDGKLWPDGAAGQADGNEAATVQPEQDSATAIHGCWIDAERPDSFKIRFPEPAIPDVIRGRLKATQRLGFRLWLGNSADNTYLIAVRPWDGQKHIVIADDEYTAALEMAYATGVELGAG